MDELVQQVKKLISDTEKHQQQYRVTGYHIDALACGIRVQAFKDILKILESLLK